MAALAGYLRVVGGILVLRLALMAGTAAPALLPSTRVHREELETPYGRPSARLCSWSAGQAEVFFMARHGEAGGIPPHRVNYRANIWALAQQNPDFILSINAVGGIHSSAVPGRIVLPNQIIDYSWGREQTYVETSDDPVRHVDFSQPISSEIHARIAAAAGEKALDPMLEATYGVTQGPRLETAAEIDRLERDGCDIVGMTAMPEAALARELDLPFVICALVVNYAAGRGPGEQDIHTEIERHLQQCTNAAAVLIQALVTEA